MKWGGSVINIDPPHFLVGGKVSDEGRSYATDSTDDAGFVGVDPEYRTHATVAGMPGVDDDTKEASEREAEMARQGGSTVAFVFPSEDEAEETESSEKEEKSTESSEQKDSSGLMNFK